MGGTRQLVTPNAQHLCHSNASTRPPLEFRTQQQRLYIIDSNNKKSRNKSETNEKNMPGSLHPTGGTMLEFLHAAKSPKENQTRHRMTQTQTQHRFPAPSAF